MKRFQLLAGSALVGATALGGAAAAIAGSTTGTEAAANRGTLAQGFAEPSLGILGEPASRAGDRRVAVRESGLTISVAREDDGTTCLSAATSNGGPGACFTDDQIAAGIAYARYQENAATDGLIVGLVADGAVSVTVDGEIHVDVLNNVWYAYVAPLTGGSSYTVMPSDGSAPIEVDVITPAEQPVPKPG